MPQMLLKQPGFTYSACVLYTKNKERTEMFINTGNTDFVYKNKLYKACFQHNMAYGDFKDLLKAFGMASNRKYDGYQRGLVSMVYTFFDKKFSGSGVVLNQLANELHKPLVTKFKKRKVNFLFKDNIWGVGLADMQLISK